MATSFLIKSRHGTCYYFRRRVPEDIRPIVGKPYLVKSLNTESRKEAIILARALAAQTDTIFQRIRKMDNKKDFDDPLPVGYTMVVELGDDDKPRKISWDAKPEEMDAVNSNIAAIFHNLPNASGATRPSHKAKPFKEALDEFYAKSGIKDSTIATYRSRLGYALQHFGERFDILSIDQAQLVEYSEYVHTTVEDLSTQEYYITTFAGFLKWHRTRAGMHPLTTETLIRRKKTPDSGDRDGFTLDQMRAIFQNAYKYRKLEPHKFWATVATAFLSCRIEELCQANLETDLHHDKEANIWYLTLDERPDKDSIVRKSLKNKASWRVIPIHSTLIRHGFLDYLEAQKAKGFKRPFEAGWKPRIIENDKGGTYKWSHYVTNWGGRELNKLDEAGLLSKGNATYFHSMRHSAKRLLGEAGVASDISEALAGRGASSAIGERYEKLKNNYRRLSAEGVEKGFGQLASLLDEIGNKS